jgi:hypothetical protein
MWHHGQARERPQPRPPAPPDARVGDGHPQVRPAREQRSQRAPAFDARELVAQAVVDARAEGEMPVGSPPEIEPVGMPVRQGVLLAAASMAMILSPLRTRTPSRTRSRRTKRGFENWTGETNRKSSSTARVPRPQSAASQSRRLGSLASSWTDPLIRWVVVSVPAPSSRKTMATISRGLIRPPSLSTRTSSAIRPSPPSARAESRRPPR